MEHRQFFTPEHWTSVPTWAHETMGGFPLQGNPLGAHQQHNQFQTRAKGRNWEHKPEEGKKACCRMLKLSLFRKNPRLLQVQLLSGARWLKQVTQKGAEIKTENNHNKLGNILLNELQLLTNSLHYALQKAWNSRIGATGMVGHRHVLKWLRHKKSTSVEMTAAPLERERQPHGYRTSPTPQNTGSIPVSPWDSTGKIIEFLALSPVINTRGIVRLPACLRSSDWICNNRDHRSAQALVKTTSRHFVSLLLP